MEEHEDFELESQKGLTLIEVLIGAVITVVILGTAMTVFTGVGNLWSVNTGNVEQRADVRRALDRISRDTRAAQLVTNADAISFEFQMLTASFTDVVPSQDPNLMTIGYSIVDLGAYSQVKRTITLPDTDPSTALLADFVRNNTVTGGGADPDRDLFHYYDSQGIEIARPVVDLTQVYTVRITVITDKDTANPPLEAHESTTVAIRSSTIAE